jgi:hypothetical protein
MFVPHSPLASNGAASAKTLRVSVVRSLSDSVAMIVGALTPSRAAKSPANLSASACRPGSGVRT